MKVNYPKIQNRIIEFLSIFVIFAFLSGCFFIFVYSDKEPFSNLQTLAFRIFQPTILASLGTLFSIQGKLWAWQLRLPLFLSSIILLGIAYRLLNDTIRRVLIFLSLTSWMMAGLISLGPV